MKGLNRIVLLAFVFALSLVHAQDQQVDQQGEQQADRPGANASQDPAAPPPIPPIQPKLTDEQVEPSVVIRKEEDRLIEEYSLHGRIYMVKVTPDNGLPYYYMDEDGDGMLELQPGEEAHGPVRPAFWKIKEW